jgi:Protein of unknown function (DUF3485)
MSAGTSSERASAKIVESNPSIFPWWRSLVVLILATVAVGAVYLTREATGISEAGITMTLPDAVGTYIGFDRAISESEKQFLPKDTEFAKKAYIGASPAEITCEIVLSGAQRNSIHRPQVCLVGQGWTIVDERVLPILLANHRPQKIRLLTLTRVENGQKINGYFLYWFVGKDTTTDDHLQRILLTSWDRITKGTNHRWAYVIVSGIMPAKSRNSDAVRKELLDHLTGFARDIVPLIQKPQVNAG